MKKLQIAGTAVAALLVVGGVAAYAAADDSGSNAAQSSYTTGEPTEAPKADYPVSTEPTKAPVEQVSQEDEEKELFLSTVYDGAQLMWDGYTPEMQEQICVGYESIGATTAEGIGQAIEDQGIDVTAFVPTDEIPAGVTVDEALNAAFQVFVDGCGF